MTPPPRRTKCGSAASVMTRRTETRYVSDWVEREPRDAVCRRVVEAMRDFDAGRGGVRELELKHRLGRSTLSHALSRRNAAGEKS